MKLDDRDIVCETDYSPLSNAELVTQIERYAAITRAAPLIDFDLEWITGPARALAARVAELEAASELAIDKWADAARSETQLRLDAAEARVAELESALGGLDALAPDYELPDGAAVAMAIGNGQILTAGRHAIHSAVMSVIDSNRDNEALRARVAELEAQLAAQQWRPVTEKPEKPGWYVVYDSDGHVFYNAEIFPYRVARWTGKWDSAFNGLVDYWRPLPPAPQETTQ
jgi:BMFP domain-containing protein YqiC